MVLNKLGSEFSVVDESNDGNKNSELIEKRSNLLIKYIQLLYQDVHTHVSQFWQQ
jgi:hypothetical protein